MADDFLEFEVGTADLRRGLQAILPHVQPDADAPDTHRIRVELRGEGQDTELLLIATDGWTAASYAGTAREASCIGMDYFDIAPYDVPKILAVFKAGKDDDPDAGESVVRFHVTEKLLRIRDVSGLFEGHELELPATPPGQWPNVARLLGEHLAGEPDGHVTENARRSRIELTGKYLERFAKSARFIGSPVVIDTDRAPLLIQCSDVFVGMVMPGRVSDEQQAIYSGRRRAWADSLVRLGTVEKGRQADLDSVTERLQEAIRYVGTRQVTTVKGLREGLSIGQAEADQLIKDLRAAGLVGPAKRGKAAPALFSPDEVDAAIECVRLGLVWEVVEVATVAEPNEAPADDLTTPAPFTCKRCDQGATALTEGFCSECLEEVEADNSESPDPAGEWAPAEAPVPTSWEADDESIPAELAAVDAFAAAAGDPFSDRQAAPDPFRDSDGNEWPTVANPFGK